jgi:hypothetical protein
MEQRRSWRRLTRRHCSFAGASGSKTHRRAPAWDDHRSSEAEGWARGQTLGFRFDAVVRSTLRSSLYAGDLGIALLVAECAEPDASHVPLLENP